MMTLLSQLKSLQGIEQKILISVAAGVNISSMKNHLPKTPIVRAMPNIASALGQSMTCLCAEDEDLESLKMAEKIFTGIGQTMIIDEEQMSAATALAACGLAFFLRSIRAASQGGIEIGFHAEQAIKIAAQTSKGAAMMLTSEVNHPEFEIDKVTTPQGATIAGLNEMEHRGFSSAFIKGLVTSAKKISNLLNF